MNSNRGKKNSLSSEGEQSNDDIWDDTLIIRKYEESLAMVKEEVAKRLAMRTNKKAAQAKAAVVKSEQLAEAGTSSSALPAAAFSSQEAKQDEEESSGVEGSTGGGGGGEEKGAVETGGKPVYKVGDYCRATYEDDGVDYEAKIMAIGKNQDTLIRFIGYNNEQTATLDDLVPSWGRKSRRKQREDAAEEAAEADSHRMEISDDEEKLTKKASKIRINYGPGFPAQTSAAFGAGMGASFMVPPPPPMPPMLEHEDDLESENLSAMLMSWYMSGYYTGLYHGQKMSQKRARPS
uniref:Survival motor neuron protein n=1 Tax=Culex pipiens TaxID=7175 RepID=A0A8D8D6J3_CULPI